MEKTHYAFDAASIAIQANHVPLLRAYVGRAKTMLMSSIAKRAGRKLIPLVGSMTDPVDLKGLPFIVDGEVRYAPEQMFREAVRLDGKVLIFLDELTTFPLAVRASALKMIHERIVGPHVLPPNTAFAAACNAAIDAPNGRPLDAPIVNRMVVIDMPPLTRDDVRSWARTNISGFKGKEADIEWTVVPDNWASFRPAVAKLVEAWSDVADNWKAWDERATQNEKGDFDPFGSLRSWDMATDLIAAARASGIEFSDDRMFFLVAGCVGRANATSLLTEMKVVVRVPTPEEILSGAKTVPEGMFETRLAMTRLVDYVSENDSVEIAKRVTQILIFMSDSRGASVCRVPMARLYALLMERQLANSDFGKEASAKIAENRIRMGLD